MVPKMEKCKQEREENLKFSLLCTEQQFSLNCLYINEKYTIHPSVYLKSLISRS